MDRKAGFALIEVILSVALLSFIVSIGTVIALFYYAESTNQRYAMTLERALTIAKVMARKAEDVDGDGYYEIPVSPKEGEVPTSIYSHPIDYFGNAYYYCTWDLGNDTDVPEEGLTLRIMSAGRDGKFETTCEDVSPKGDDVFVNFYQEDVKVYASEADVGWWKAIRNDNGTVDLVNRNDGSVGVGVSTIIGDFNSRQGVTAGQTTLDDYPYFLLVNKSPKSGYYYTVIFNDKDSLTSYYAVSPDTDGNKANLTFYEYGCPNGDCNIPEVHLYADLLTVEGNLYVKGRIYGGGFFSDRRLKTSVKHLNFKDAEGLMKLKPVSFNYKGDRRKRFGLIAQEVKSVYPNLVEKTPDGYLQVDYEELIPLLILKVQELTQQVESLKRQLKSKTTR